MRYADEVLKVLARVECGFDPPLVCSGRCVEDAHGRGVATFRSAAMAELFVDGVAWALEGGAEWEANLREQDRLVGELDDVDRRFREALVTIESLKAKLAVATREGVTGQ